MATLNEIAQSIIDSLRVTDPDLDTSTGTTARKIIDAAAEGMSELVIDNHLLTYQYDIDAKIGAALDDFVQLFGMARLPAKRGSGTVTFTRTQQLTKTVLIPIHTQVRSSGTPSIVVQTVTSGFLEPGATQVSVPVQAVEAGAQGNLGAGTLTLLNSPVPGVAGVTNVSALAGGTPQEDDDALRTRWKKTVFRNLAGTEQMYLGVALDDPDCYAATVVGSSKRRREQVQIVGGGATLTVDDARTVYTQPVFVGRNIDGGDLYLTDQDYSWNTGVNPPQVLVLDATAIPDGTIVEVDYEYEPLSSRNDVAHQITNRVDIWCGGERALAASQVLIFRRGVLFSSTPGDALAATRFVRTDGTAPTVGNIFVPLAFGPVLTIPPTLTIAGTIYAQATAANPMGSTGTSGSDTIYYSYRLVHEDGASGWTPTSKFGLEWDATNRPADRTSFAVGANDDYTFNAMITSIQTVIERWRLLGVDAKAHQAKQVALRLNLAVMYDRGANTALVNSQVEQAVSTIFTTGGFATRVQVSDLLQAIHNVPGVDNVRFLHAGDYPTYSSANPNAYGVGLQRVVEGTVIASYVDALGRARDLYLGDSELPVLDSLNISVRAQNSFGG